MFLEAVPARTAFLNVKALGAKANVVVVGSTGGFLTLCVSILQACMLYQYMHKMVKDCLLPRLTVSISSLECTLTARFNIPNTQHSDWDCSSCFSLLPPRLCPRPLYFVLLITTFVHRTIQNLLPTLRPLLKPIPFWPALQLQPSRCPPSSSHSSQQSKISLWVAAYVRYPLSQCTEAVSL